MKLPDVKQIQLAMRSGGGIDWSESEESLRAKVTRSSKVKSGRTDHGLDGNVCHSFELNSRATRTRGLLCEFDDSQVFAQTHEGYLTWFYMTVPRLRARAMQIAVGGDCGPSVGNSQMRRAEEQ